MKLKNAVQAYAAAYNDLEAIIDNIDRREGYACLNIKIYKSWKWKQDINEYFEQNPAAPDIQERVRQEFTEERINGLINHVHSFEVDYFKDWIGQATYNKGEHEYNLLQNFDFKDVYQFGRSGGWISFAKYADLESYKEDEYLSMSEFCQQYKPEQTRSAIIEAWKEICSYFLPEHEQLTKIAAELQHYTKHLNDYKEALNFVINHVKDSKENITEAYSDQLYYEIDEFLDTYCIDIADRIKRGYQHPAKIEGGKLYTTEGAAVPLQEIHSLINAIEAGQDVTGRKAGAFIIMSHQEHEGKNYYQIGCHFMQLEEIKNFVNTEA